MREQADYGRKLWSLLHSMAAYFPPEPTEEDKEAATTFMETFMDVGIEYDEWG